MQILQFLLILDFGINLLKSFISNLDFNLIIFFFKKKKIDEYKLDTTPKSIIGRYKINNFKDKYALLKLNIFSFDET